METVGAILRATREERGLSVKDVEAATSIRALYINAIEDGNFSVIPGEVYVKGFIRNYANYLGMDGQSMVNMYRESQQATLPEISETEPVQSSRPNNSVGVPSKRLIIGLIAVLVAGGSLWLFSGTTKDTNNPPLAQTTPTQPLTPPQVAQTPITQPNPPKPNKPVVVTAKFTDECWALITVDGKEVFEGIAKSGDTFTWEGDQAIIVKLGNAGAAELTFNGQSVGTQGGKGEVIVKTFSANTMKKP